MGQLPGTVFGLEKPPISIKLSPIDLTKLVQNSELKKNQCICLKIEGEHDEHVMIKDVDFNLSNNSLVHVDFERVSDDVKVKVHVPISPEGTAKGQRLGGVLVTPKRTILIESFPKKIPVSISVNISDLGIGDSIRSKHLELPSGSVLISNENDVLLKVESTKVSKEMTSAEGSEESSE